MEDGWSFPLVVDEDDEDDEEDDRPPAELTLRLVFTVEGEAVYKPVELSSRRNNNSYKSRRPKEVCVGTCSGDAAASYPAGRRSTAMSSVEGLVGGHRFTHEIPVEIKGKSKTIEARHSPLDWGSSTVTAVPGMVELGSRPLFAEIREVPADGASASTVVERCSHLAGLSCISGGGSTHQIAREIKGEGPASMLPESVVRAAAEIDRIGTLKVVEPCSHLTKKASVEPSSQVAQIPVPAVEPCSRGGDMQMQSFRVPLARTDGHMRVSDRTVGRSDDGGPTAGAPRPCAVARWVVRSDVVQCEATGGDLLSVEHILSEVEPRRRAVETWSIRSDSVQESTGEVGKQLVEVAGDEVGVAFVVPSETLQSEVTAGDVAHDSWKSSTDREAFVDPMVAFVGPNWELGYMYLGLEDLVESKGSVDPFLHSKVGQHSEACLEVRPNTLKIAEVPFPLDLAVGSGVAGLQVGQDVGPDYDWQSVAFSNLCAKHLVPPPVGFVWKYSANSWAFFQDYGVRSTGGDDQSFEMSKDVGDGTNSVANYSQDEDLDPMDSVSEFERNLRILLPSLMEGKEDDRQKNLKGTRESKRQKRSSPKWTEDAGLVAEPPESAKKKMTRAVTREAATDSARERFTDSVNTVRRSLEFLQQHAETMGDEAIAEEAREQGRS